MKYIFLVLLFSNLSYANNIKDIRFWPSPDNARLTIESNEAIEYKVFKLSDPDRLVIDIFNVDDPKSFKKKFDLKVDNNLYVKSIRYGSRNSNTSRIVLDLKQKINEQTFILEPVYDYGFRLVLDLIPSKIVANVLKKIPKKREVFIVAIDAGHGGEDPGAIGLNRTQEKKITLEISKKIMKLLESENKIKGVLIRTGDYYIPLRKRVAKARNFNSDVLLSIHADAFKRRSANGSSVYTLSSKGASSEAARWIAAKENDADLVGGINIDVEDDILKKVLIDLSQDASMIQSNKLASNILKNLGTVNKLHKKKVEQAGFVVLKAPDIPSVLIETAFLSNPKEEKNLNDPTYQMKLAKAIVKGIKNFVNEIEQ